VYTLFAPFSSSYPFPCHLLSIPTLGHCLFHTSVLEFCTKPIKDKKTWCFCLFEIKIPTQAVSLCCFPAYVYYSSNWFTSSLLTCPLPMVARATLQFLYLSLYSEHKHINHIQVFVFSPLPDPSHAWPPLELS
jgi:hypothetical protein